MGQQRSTSITMTGYIVDEETKSLESVIKEDTKDRIEVEIGDSKDSSEFFPQAKIMRWDNEVNFSIRYKEDETISEKVVDTVDDKFVWEKDDKAVYIYDKTEVGEDGGLEFEVVFNKKPQNNVVEFTIETKGLDFLYQPEISDEEAQRLVDALADKEEITLEEAKRRIRPENVVGSYAVYHKEKAGNYTDKEYKTGKFCHIYRPKLIDADGKEIWGEIHIDTEEKQLAITVDPTFLETAKYPVIVDPTLGYTSEGGSDANLINTNENRMSRYTMPSGASVSKGTAFWHSDGSTSSYLKAVLWLVSDGTVATNGVGAANSTSSSSYVEVDSTFSTAPTVSNVDYWIGVVNGTGGSVSYLAYDSGWTSNYGAYDVLNSYSSPETLGDPIPLQTNDYRFSIYVTYTTGGSAGPAGVKTINDVAIADVKTINDTAIADVKTINDAS